MERGFTLNGQHCSILGVVGLLVFDKNELLQAVLSNDGTACPFFNAVHDEKINLENTFTFAIPADHTDAQYVTEGSLVAFKDLDSEWQG